MSLKARTIVPISILVVLSVFLMYSDETVSNPDFKGIVSDIDVRSNGFTFTLNTYDRSIHCFSTLCPEDMKYYGVEGVFSQDGMTFFVDVLVPLE